MTRKRRANPGHSAPGEEGGEERLSRPKRMTERYPRRLIGFVALAVGIVLLAFAAALIFTKKAGRIPCLREANILLITIDTLRSDRVGVYGYREARTPHLDSLADKGVLFKTVYSPTPLTLPSHISIMTGTSPLYHRVRNNGNYFLAEDVTTLAELLSGRGYSTAAFVSAFVLDSRYGLNQGFGYYGDRIESSETSAWYAERRAEETYLEFNKWFQAHRSDKFFAWIHFWDPHLEYDPPEPYKSQFEDPYDGEVAYVDAQIGSILNLLAEAGVLNKTFLIVASDHGEAFGEHGEIGHSIFCYQENILVPLILFADGALPPGKQILTPVSLIDVMPTVLDSLGMEIPDFVQGKSLLPMIQGRRESDRPFYLESYYPLEDLAAAPVVGFIAGQTKFFNLPRPELYNLHKDPGEKHNLAPEKGTELSSRKEALARLIQSLSTGAFKSEKPISAEERERLASLGYASLGLTGPDSSNLPDPKDVVESATAIVQGKRLTVQKRIEEAEASFRKAIEIHPGNLTAYLLLSELLNRLGRKEEAWSVLQAGIDRNPGDSRLEFRLALILLNEGKPDEALLHLEKIRTSGNSFDSVGLYQTLSLAAERSGDAEMALDYGKKILEFDPDKDGKNRLRVALLLLKGGEITEAVKVLDSIGPEGVNETVVSHTLAVSYARLGLYDRAERWFEKTLALPDAPPNAIYNYALMSKERGSPERAVQLLRTFVSQVRREDPLAQQALVLLKKWNAEKK